MNPIELGDLNDYRFFAVVVEEGGFSAAARRLGLPKSRLSRRVALLEQRLGVRLLQRSTRRLTLTDIGQQVLAHSQALVQEAEAAANAASQRQAVPSGHLRVSAPSALLDSDLDRVFVGFLADHPQVTLEFVLTTRRVDPIVEGIDLALRVRSADDEDPQWATRRLRRAEGVLVASPALVARLGGLWTLADVQQAPGLGPPAPDRKLRVPLRRSDGREAEVTMPLRLACEHFGTRLHAAEAGLGVTSLPEPLAREALAAGRLVHVLPDWAPPGGWLQAVYPTQRGMTPALRGLLDRLAEAAADEPFT